MGGESEILEMKLATEEATRKNVLACIEHGNESRRIARRSEVEVNRLKAIILQQDTMIKDLKREIGTFKGQLYLLKSE